ncbi:PREDICTED: alpha/beta-gliadin-like [Tarenaya hassleriana]|uniref:alpha/beta-gliadin-like n=1 Tax=Tarenaya hassleriana TaxID=28532 RepID=UPI00053C91BA|nr:PREDICTED: alpha/beta-gliadin-like [Tarenaya hassleriana]
MWVQPMWPQLTPPMWSSSQQPPVMWPQPSPYPWWPMYQQPQPWLLVPQMLPWPPPTTTPYFVPLTEGSQSQPEVEHHHPPPQEQLSLPQSPRTEENEGADEEHGQDEGIEAHGEKTILENGVATPPH